MYQHNTARKIGNVIVMKRNIASTSIFTYEAWEVSGNWNSHQTTTSIYPDDFDTPVDFEERLLAGNIASRFAPPELKAMKPFSKERMAAFRKFRAANEEEAYQAILQAFPHLRSLNHRKSAGTIETYDEHGPYIYEGLQTIAVAQAAA